MTLTILPSERTRRPQHPVDVDRLRELNAAGVSDEAIGDTLGHAQGTITRARHRLRLPRAISPAEASARANARRWGHA